MERLLLLGFRGSFTAAVITITWLALSTSAVVDVFAWWDKGNHFLAFLVLAFLLDYSWPSQARWQAAVNQAKWTSLLAYGLCIELLQWYSGERQFELADVAADAVGILVYLAIRPLTQRVTLLKKLLVHSQANQY